jgi:predicted ATPase
MIYLSSLRRRPAYPRDPDIFPWSLPFIRDLEELAFSAPVTFLVGENGSGKSTVLEGIAAGMDAVASGGQDLRQDLSLAAARSFAEGFLFARRRHARTRLFLRAEDVFGFTSRVSNDIGDLTVAEAELKASLPEDYGRQIAAGAVRGQRLALVRSYGANPDGRSHGETFLALLRRRLAPRGLYFLDEPETPMSPTRVLALMALLNDAVAQHSQFVIATHSPILLAFPGAEILAISGAAFRRAAWDELEQVRVTRAFLSDPSATLQKLLKA